MNEALSGFLGNRVKVWTRGSGDYYYTDEGVLEAFDHPWLRLREDTGRIVCVPAYAIRQIRLAPLGTEVPELEQTEAA